MTSSPTWRQEDALREVAHLGHSHGATMLARLVGDVGVLVDTPRLLRGYRWQLGWILGGRESQAVAATFGVQGNLSGELWWVLEASHAQRLGRRLLSRPGLFGPLSANTGAALAEASNIVASATLDAIGGFAKLKLVPTTPSLLETTVGALVGPEGGGALLTMLASPFTSTDARSFEGWSILFLDDAERESLLRRLGV